MKTPLPASLGSYLRKLREQQKLSQLQVAQLTGGLVPSNWLSQLERGRIARPALDRLTALAKVYGVSALDLLMRAGHLSQEEASQLAEQAQSTKTKAAWRRRRQAQEEPVQKLRGPGANEGEGPMPLEQLRAYSRGLANFLTSKEAQLLRLSWREVHQLLSVPGRAEASSKAAAKWRELVLALRAWDGRSPFGLENPEEELVWRAGKPPGQEVQAEGPSPSR